MSKILVLEDDAILQKIDKGFLADIYGYDVTIAGNCKAGLQAYRDAIEIGKPYQIIILDGSLPDGTGAQVAKEIRGNDKRKNLPRTPLLLLSAYMREHIEEMAQEGDIDKWFQKPVEWKNVKAVIEDFLKH